MSLSGASSKLKLARTGLAWRRPKAKRLPHGDRPGSARAVPLLPRRRRPADRAASQSVSFLLVSTFRSRTPRAARSPHHDARRGGEHGTNAAAAAAPRCATRHTGPPPAPGTRERRGRGAAARRGGTARGGTRRNVRETESRSGWANVVFFHPGNDDRCSNTLLSDSVTYLRIQNTKIEEHGATTR